MRSVLERLAETVLTRATAASPRVELVSAAVEARALWQELDRQVTEHLACLAEYARPNAEGAELAVAAALVELLAERRGETPPPWTQEAPSLEEPLFLVAARSDRRRKRLREESPEPLKKRNLYAPSNYMSLA